MPSAFETAFAANADGLYAQFGRAATYIAPDATVSNSITVRVRPADASQSSDPRIRGEIQTAEILVREGEVAKPVKDGRFAIEGGSEVWTITTMPVHKNGQFYCTCSRKGVERMGDRRAR